MKVHLEQIDGRRLRVRARGLELIVDDTIEAGGPGDGFRPTELLMGALAACMAGTMINFANSQGITVNGIQMELEDAVAKGPTRIGRISISMEVGADATDRQRGSLERVAGACKIHNTLEHPPEMDFEFTVS